MEFGRNGQDRIGSWCVGQSVSRNSSPLAFRSTRRRCIRVQPGRVRNRSIENMGLLRLTVLPPPHEHCRPGESVAFPQLVVYPRGSGATRLVCRSGTRPQRGKGRGLASAKRNTFEA
jgi:hypothetical protein